MKSREAIYKVYNSEIEPLQSPTLKERIHSGRKSGDNYDAGWGAGGGMGMRLGKGSRVGRGKGMGLGKAFVLAGARAEDQVRVPAGTNI